MLGRLLAAAVFTFSGSVSACAIHTISSADYPRESRNRGEEGTVSISYRINPDGTVAAGSCSVIKSSGYRRLDQGTCQLIEAKFCFRPDTEPKEGTQTIRWRR